MSITRRLFLRNSAAAGAVGVVTAVPNDVAKAADPRTRLAMAVENLKEAMQDAYGITPQDCSQITKGSAVIAISILAHPDDALHWSIEDGSPLLADDVTGSTAFADWEARRRTERT